MQTLLQVFGLIVLAVLFAFLSALVAAGFMYLAWNHGVVHAIPATREIDLASAFWVCLFISFVTGIAKSELKTK